MGTRDIKFQEFEVRRETTDEVFAEVSPSTWFHAVAPLTRSIRRQKTWIRTVFGRGRALSGFRKGRYLAKEILGDARSGEERYFGMVPLYDTDKVTTKAKAGIFRTSTNRVRGNRVVTSFNAIHEDCEFAPNARFVFRIPKGKK